MRHVCSQGVSGSNVYAAPNLDLLWKDDYSVMEFPKGNLKFLEKLGEGQFGEVRCVELSVSSLRTAFVALVWLM